MSTTESEKEPSMEEILASIRRIISEDETPEARKDAEDADDEQAEDDADVLVLTEVIDQAREEVEPAADDSGQEIEPEPEFESEVEPEPEVDSEAELEPEPGPEVEQELEPGPEVEQELEPGPEVEQELEPETESEPEAEMEPTQEEDNVTDMPEEPETADEEEPAQDTVIDLVDDIDERNEELMEEPAAMPETIDDNLVSAATTAAAVAALTEVPRAVANNRPLEPQTIIGGQKTLEAVVRDAMAPHLSAWLDENLPSLVERVVQEEVRRMVRRAEDN